MKRLRSWLSANARNLWALFGLLAIVGGFGWWVHPGAGLCIGGFIVMGLLVYAHLRGLHDDEAE